MFKRRKSTLSQEIFPDEVSGSPRPLKRLKSGQHDQTQEHAEDCTTLTCAGCAVGEIELQFTAEDGTTTTTTPHPTDLFAMAFEETMSQTSRTDSMARLLFDRAIEGFEALSEEEKQDINIKAKHAACLVDFGRIWKVKESVREGIEIFERIIATGEIDNGVELASVYLRLGRGRVVLGRLKRNDISEGEEVGVDMTKAEEELFRKGIAALDNGLQILSVLDRNAHTRESVIAAKELHSFGLAINPVHNQRQVRKILTHAIAYLTKTYATEPRLLDRDPYIVGLFGACLFGLARTSPEGSEEAKDLLDQSIEKLQKAVKLTFPAVAVSAHLETLGQAYIMKSNLTDDDDEAVVALDHAVSVLQRVYEAEPGNVNLRDQLVALGVGEEEEDESENDDGKEDVEEEKEEEEE